uniref:Interferon-gamma-inducible GTPase IFGGC3 protein n=1 Tax=Cavia porcellus TaxID=10141 RepID=H0VXU5_CAVPO|nr:T-cell-specific guanine nucleotide triphosphate-binding protein 1 [Cavia porcellus]CBY66016.1 TPA: interferon-gamma-inducible GTPase IFGGC3 protein [Cavia porcellus]
MSDFLSDVLKNLYQKDFKKVADEFMSHYLKLTGVTRGIISPEKLKNIQATFSEGNLKAAVDIIEEILSGAKNAALEVAVIGASGTGKSSFINALRGLGHEEEGAAEVGVVETTMEKTPYKHPQYPNVTFWDLPGTGTPTFAPDTYLEAVGFATFDFFIIISSSRFTCSDGLLAQKIQEAGKNFYFVRSKVDCDLDNERRAKPKSFQRERVLQEIRDYCLANLRNMGVTDPPIFLVSNFELHGFDFPGLQRTLLGELPAHKRQVFALMLPALSDASIELKRSILKEKIWLEALKLAAVAFIPFGSIFKGFDLPEQEQCLQLYQKYFGLDDESIEEIAKKLHTSVQDIKGELRCLDSSALLQDDSKAAMAMYCAEKFCSVTGGPISSTMHFVKAYSIRLKILDAVAQDAKVLLHKTLRAPF